MCFHGLDYRGVSHGTSPLFHLPSSFFLLTSYILHLPSYIIHLSCSNVSKIAPPIFERSSKSTVETLFPTFDDAKVDKPRNCAKLSA